MNIVEKKLFLSSVVDELRHYSFNPDVRKFIACQFALECDYGRSHLARYFNNYSGMKYPKSRITSSLNMCIDYCNYVCFTDCILDYVLWLTYNRCMKDIKLEEFKEFLIKKSYCPESDYISKIEAIYNQFFN